MLPTERTLPKQDLADLSVLIYGPSKIGKSTWCSHAEGALFLATEPGLNALEVFQLPVSTWDDLLGACGEIASGQHDFKTIIIDTVDNAYRMCAEFICQKQGVDHESELGYGKGYALIQNEFLRVLTKLAFLSSGLFLVSHAQEKEIETRTGRHIKTIPTLPDKPRRIVLGLVDLVLYCDIETEHDGDGKPVYRRVMRTKPSPHYDAGDRTGRLPETIDLDYPTFLRTFSREDR